MWPWNLGHQRKLQERKQGENFPVLKPHLCNRFQLYDSFTLDAFVTSLNDLLTMIQIVLKRNFPQCLLPISKLITEVFAICSLAPFLVKREDQTHGKLSKIKRILETIYQTFICTLIIDIFLVKEASKKFLKLHDLDWIFHTFRITLLYLYKYFYNQ